MSSSASLSSPAAVRFFDAVYNNQLKALKYIMKREKVDPNIGDIRQPSHPTALIHACENLNINLARALLEAKPVGADVNKSDQNGRRAIWWAVHHGNVELAELLIKEFKCEVDFTDKITGCTPLYRAVMAQSLELSALLILGGANVNQFSMDCSTEVETPLILAVLKDDIKMCQLLVKSLCNINHRTQEGFTALHFAVAYERFAAIMNTVQCLNKQLLFLHSMFLLNIMFYSGVLSSEQCSEICCV
ncbi:hypothetical protein EB796_006912 [Bugula neritina]|uniref:Uncharacterized protein n=1 Tax=Bugula neritina TaxID=10212 RepID=A0A7J7K993_BUGNE|nr:hypothetical protein EB796_006912 [Bugula neritina]